MPEQIAIELPIPGGMGDVKQNLSKLVFWANELGLNGKRVVTVDTAVRPFSQVTDIQAECLERIGDHGDNGDNHKEDSNDGQVE